MSWSNYTFINTLDSGQSFKVHKDQFEAVRKYAQRTKTVISSRPAKGDYYRIWVLKPNDVEVVV